MNRAIYYLYEAAERCNHNAPIHEAEGMLEQAALDRKLAEEYVQAARQLEAL